MMIALPVGIQSFADLRKKDNLYEEVRKSLMQHFDAVWTWKDRVVVAEVKHAEKGALESLLKEAFDQIHNRRYYEGYADDNRRIALLVIAVEEREIECRIEELNKN